MTTCQNIVDLKMNIKINEEYAKLVHPLTHLELNSLKESIKNNGQWYPIIVNQKGFILDGHHNFEVCQELSIEPKK